MSKDDSAKPTVADWEALADKESRGRDLSWDTPEGFTIKPLYTARGRDRSRPTGFRAIHARCEGQHVCGPPVDDPAICGLFHR